MGSSELNPLTLRIEENETIGLQIAIVLQYADPVFALLLDHGQKLWGEIPPVKQGPLESQVMGDSVFNQLSRQGDLGAKLLVQGAKRRISLSRC